MGYLLDTNFLIGLWRKRGEGAEATLLAQHPDEVLAIPWVSKGEFLCGAVIANHDLERVSEFLAEFPVIWPDDGVLQRYALIYRRLREQRQQVGANDLWIAAAALERRLPLLTRNVRELSRIEGLQVVDYAGA